LENVLQNTSYPPSDRVYIFQPQFVEFGGEERVILALSEELFKQGKPHVVLCYWDSINLKQYATWPIEVYELNPPKNPISKMLALRNFLNYLSKNNSPIPILFNIQSALHAGMVLASRYHIRIPDTYSLLGFGKQIESKVNFKRWLRDKAMHIATKNGIVNSIKFITNTKALEDEMLALYGKQAKTIYLGGFGQVVDHKHFNKNEPVRLFSVSRLQSSKRIDWIIRALHHLSFNDKRLPNWQLDIAGMGPAANQLKTLTQQLGLDEFVKFHGFVSDDKLKSLYKNAHIFLMPAQQGYGLPAIEALYQKIAVVVSHQSGVVELLKDTPWAEVAFDGEPGFEKALGIMMFKVVQEGFFETPMPHLPTQEGWAKEMVTYCEW
jgi:glycosyltransferase involved in cell wall biosynthesis